MSKKRNPAVLWLEKALIAHQQGRLEDALNGYKKVLRHQPNHSSALANLASIYTRRAHYPEALVCYQKALQGDQITPELWFNHGNLQQRMGMIDAAIQSFKSALQHNPALYQAHYNLGNLLCHQDRQEEAVVHYQATIRLDPTFVPAYRKLCHTFIHLNRTESIKSLFGQALTRFPEDVKLLRQYGDWLYYQDDAKAALIVYQKIQWLQPNQSSIYNALGVVYRAVGNSAAAMKAWRQCLAIDANHVEALTNLGALCRLKKRHDEAMVYLRKAVDVRPKDADSVASLACALIDLGSISEALLQLEPALASHPEHVDLLGMKAFALVQQARIEEGQALLAKARQLKPDSQVAIGNTLFSSLYRDTFDAAAQTRFHQQLSVHASRHIKPLPARRPARCTLGGDSGRVRIGYLSPDFRSHPIGFFIEPLLKHHRADQFHITCYALPCAQDAATERFKSYAHRWRDFEGWTLHKMVAQIQQDGIDILVDLAGYTAGGRMDLMASKPAPIQAIFLGYPYTTGLEAMDYIIADRFLIPPTLENLYTERIVRLDKSFLCYQPQLGTPNVAPLPAMANGMITFGSYNNLPKLSASCLALWAQVLKAVPGSRLILMASSLADEGTRTLFQQHFLKLGIATDRILPLPPVMPLTQFLAEYSRLDIALDPIPFNGGTTSCDALWMGVPVITLAGVGFMSRMGVSLLNTIHHPEWIASDKENYVNIAKRLASDVPKLAHIRATLRAQVMASGLCDAVGYTSSLEGIYGSMMDAAPPSSSSITPPSQKAKQKTNFIRDSEKKFRDMVVIPVLGMHRSGTSMFTRSLNLMGVQLGPELLGSTRSNSKGYWEDLFFVSKNVAMLRSLGMNTDGFGLMKNLVNAHRNSQHLIPDDHTWATIKNYLLHTFSTGLWGWKDPRTVLLYPFWHKILSHLGVGHIRPMIIVRHPQSCLNSLLKPPYRGGMAQMSGQYGIETQTFILDQWKCYNRILDVLSDQTDCFISFFEWLSDPKQVRSEMVRCAARLGKENRQVNQAVSWVDPNLIHHHATEETPIADPETLVIYRSLRDKAMLQRVLWEKSVGHGC